MTPPTEEHARKSILSQLNPALLSPAVPGCVCTLVLSSGQTARFASQLCEPTPCARCHDVSRPVSSSPRGPDPTCTMAVLSVVRQCHELSVFLGPRDTGCPGAASDGSCSISPRAFSHLGTCTCGSCELSGQLSLQSTRVPSNTRESNRMGTNPQHDWHLDLRGSSLVPLSPTEPSEDGEPILQDPCWVHKRIQSCVQAWEARTSQGYLVVKGKKIWKPQTGAGDQFGSKGEGEMSESMVVM